MKGTIDALGKQFPLATLLDTPIYNIVIILEPMHGMIAWKQPDGTGAASTLTVKDMRLLFYLLADNDLGLYQTMYRSKLANSTNADITFDTNAIELDNGLLETQGTMTINPFEEAPFQAQHSYNKIIDLITLSLPAEIPIVFNKIPIFWTKAFMQYIKEIPTRIKGY
jgi:hypothetical protein